MSPVKSFENLFRNSFVVSGIPLVISIEIPTTFLFWNFHDLKKKVPQAEIRDSSYNIVLEIRQATNHHCIVTFSSNSYWWIQTTFYFTTIYSFHNDKHPERCTIGFEHQSSIQYIPYNLQVEKRFILPSREKREIRTPVTRHRVENVVFRQILFFLSDLS